MSIELKNLCFNKIKEDAGNICLNGSDSYIYTYPEFLKYFEKITKINRHSLVIASHFMYGWMPRMIKLNLNEEDRVLQILNNVRCGKILEEDEIKTLKSCINNSMVGLSKLLHFINPEEYAIWDSNVFTYLTESTGDYYHVNKIELYLEYLKGIKEIAEEDKNDEVVKSILERFNKVCPGLYLSLSPLRAIEVVMFETGRKLKGNVKKYIPLINYFPINPITRNYFLSASVGFGT